MPPEKSVLMRAENKKADAVMRISKRNPKEEFAFSALVLKRKNSRPASPFTTYVAALIVDEAGQAPPEVGGAGFRTSEKNGCGRRCQTTRSRLEGLLVRFSSFHYF